MKKLKEIIDYVYDSGNLPRGMSLSDFRILEDVYYDLWNSGTAEYIQEKVNAVLNKCKIKTAPHGIGWIATV